MVLLAVANDRRKVTSCHDELCGPQFDTIDRVALETATTLLESKKLLAADQMILRPTQVTRFMPKVLRHSPHPCHSNLRT
ncbi:hypothetical protein TNCV_3550151 [Trichonephila clavipes]|nr:hypothetical protein TNCV_3550151 [Trichonephila clavipes]